MSPIMRWPHLLVWPGLLIAVALTAAPPRAHAETIETKPTIVFAAASLKNALDAIAADYQASTGSKVVISYAASSALAKQIAQMAPADVFASADLEWMNYLSEKGLINEATRSSLLGNRLVLIAPATSNPTIRITKNFALAEAIGAGRIAIGDVKSVPAGKYAKAALEALGIWASVADKLAQTENVRAALALVARGETPFGIVYQTDAISEPKVKIVDTFPEDTHAAILYPFAVTASARDADAATAFLDFLKSVPAKRRFEHAGFKFLAQ